MGAEPNSKRVSIPLMLAKLDEYYAKEEELKKSMTKLTKEYNQLRDDIELLQQLIMYQSNKNNRG